MDSFTIMFIILMCISVSFSLALAIFFIKRQQGAQEKVFKGLAVRGRAGGTGTVRFAVSTST